MALNSEDKADVKNAMGKAIANKVSKVTRDKNLELGYKIHQGRTAKKYENEANPEMHSFKNSMRRKGFSDAKIFSGALRQGEKYNAKSKALQGKKEQKKIEHLKAIKEHVSGGKKSAGFKDPFWYEKK